MKLSLKNILNVSLIVITQIKAQSSREIWLSMQQQYNNLNNILAATGDLQKDKLYCHPHWQSTKEELKHLIRGSVNENFSSYGPILANMVRHGWTSVQQYEVCYLQNCLSAKTQELIKKTHDTNFLGLHRECREFDCSTNTLAQLYYAAKTLELSNNKLTRIVEFGAGYGNLARIYKEIFPDVTYFIIDLPELLAIQYFFLKSTLPNIDIQMHTQVTKDFKEGCIHLIPAYIIDNIEIKADLFVSAFAISEASEMLQNIIGNKRFFDARSCFIVGQLVGCNHPWVHHLVLQNAVRSTYSIAECRPSYFFFHGVRAYEMIGINDK